MIKQITLIAIIIFIGHLLSAQEIILEQDVKLKAGLKSHIINHQNGILLLQFDKGNVNLHSLNEDYEIIRSLDAPRLNVDKLSFPQLMDEPISVSRKLKLMNYVVQNESCYLYLTNRPNNPGLLYKEKHSVFVAQEFNLENGRVEVHELAIQLLKETFLSSFSENGKFHLLTVKNKSSILKLYIVEGGKVIEEKEFDLSAYKFGIHDEQNLYQTIHDKVTNARPVTINYDDLYLDQKVFRHHKIYYDTNNLYLTEDSRGTATKIIVINLKDFSFVLKKYEYGKCDCFLGMPSMDTNSFLMGNYLYQIVVCDKAIYTSVFDIEKNERIQTFQARKKEIIFMDESLGNTEMEEPFFALQSTKDIMYARGALKRITKKAIGISTYKKGDHIEVVIGGMRIPFKTEADYATLVNSTSPNVCDYRILYLHNTYFKSLLKQPSFELISSTEEYALDKMNTYLKEKIESTNADVYAETMHSIQNGYILGYYSKRKKKYYLVKFLN